MVYQRRHETIKPYIFYHWVAQQVGMLVMLFFLRLLQRMWFQLKKFKIQDFKKKLVTQSYVEDIFINKIFFKNVEK